MIAVLEVQRLPNVDGSTFVRMVRRGLDNVMAHDMSSSIVFDSLEDFSSESLPNSKQEFHDFLYTKLAPALVARIGTRPTELAMRAIEESVDKGPDSPSESVRTTVRRESIDGPVGVLLLSGATALAVRMRAALGGDRVGVAVASSIAQARVVCARLMPQMFILDLEFLRDNSYEDVVGLIRELPTSVSIVVWGSRVDAAKKIGVLLRSHGRQPVGMSREVGIEPLLDMICARAG